MSKKGKHGVRNPKKSRMNPYEKRRNRGGWGNEPRDNDWREENDERWSRHDDSYEDWDDDEESDPDEEDDDDGV